MATNLKPVPPPLTEGILSDDGATVPTVWGNFFTALYRFTLPMWRDINIGGASLTKAAVNQPTLVAINGGTVLTYGFNGTTATNELHGAFEMQHDYKEESNVRPHVHWYPTTADTGDVEWRLDYVITQESGITSGTLTAISSAPGEAWKPIKVSFGELDGSGLAIEAQVHFRLYRVPTNAADTYGAIAAIGTVGLHYQVDMKGSNQLVSK